MSGGNALEDNEKEHCRRSTSPFLRPSRQQTVSDLVESCLKNLAITAYRLYGAGEDHFVAIL